MSFVEAVFQLVHSARGIIQAWQAIRISLRNKRATEFELCERPQCVSIIFANTILLRFVGTILLIGSSWSAFALEKINK